MKVKYIRTEQNIIIVFPELMQHSEFKILNPVSAGFISIGAAEKFEPTITCLGESVSLKLKSNEIEDTLLARKQILGYEY